MKLYIKTLSMTIVLLISNCGVPQADYEKLKAENVQLKQDLEDCKFGEEKLVAKIEADYENKEYNRVKINTVLFFDKYPESSKVAEFKNMLDYIQKEEIAATKKKKRQELAAQRKKEAAEKERKRLAKLNDIGVWDIRYYVDDFGEPTKSGYITTTNNIRGSFSNTATQDSKLDVRLLITDRKNISLKLFEYAGNNPVKAYSTDEYSVQIQDKDGSRYKLEANNYSERLSFDKLDSETLHQVLMKGGVVRFRITEVKTPTTQYNFQIDNADGYENARRKLFGWK